MHPTISFLREQIRNTRFENNVFVAGGFVRDLLLNKKSDDIDLVVTLPNGGIEFAEWITAKLGCRTGGNPVLFPRFGTAKFNLRVPALPDIDIEAVMPRTEAYAEGSRKPEVQFTTLEEDAKRRDFTINAMFLSVSTAEVLDLVGGRADLKAGVIRTAIDPAVIFVDDPLRMLRAVRFAVRFGWPLDDTLREAITVHALRIGTISQERIADELSKMLLASVPSDAFRLLQQTGLLALVLPEIAATVGVTQNRFHVDDVFDHTMKVLDGTPPDLLARLGALFHDCGKPTVRTEDTTGVHFYAHEEAGAALAEQALTRLRFPNEVVRAVVHMVNDHMRLKSAGADGMDASDRVLRRFRADTADIMEPLLAVMHADNCAHAPKHSMPDQIPAIRERLAQLAQAAPVVKLPVDGNDIMELFQLKPGRVVGQLLGVVKEAWFTNPDITRDEAIALVKEHMAVTPTEQGGER